MELHQFVIRTNSSRALGIETSYNLITVCLILKSLLDSHVSTIALAAVAHIAAGSASTAVAAAVVAYFLVQI